MKLGLDVYEKYHLEFYRGSDDPEFVVKMDGSAVLCAIEEYLKKSHYFGGKVLKDDHITEEDKWFLDRDKKGFYDKDGKLIRKHSVLFQVIDGKEVYGSVVSSTLHPITKDFISCVLIVKETSEKIDITSLEDLKKWVKVTVSDLAKRS